MPGGTSVEWSKTEIFGLDQRIFMPFFFF